MNESAVLALLAVGAYYFLKPKTPGTTIPGSTTPASTNPNPSSVPTYYNMSNQVVHSIECGNSIIFDVPGYQMVFLVRTKNGVQDFAGPYSVPNPPYILQCSTDVGTYNVTAYILNPDNTQGPLLGSTTFTVTPSS